MIASKQLLEFALQGAASTTTCGPMRLQSYSSFIPASAGLLTALPAATLTYLDITAHNSSWFALLSRLRTLRQLQLHMDSVPVHKVNSCLHEVGRLGQLTMLCLDQLAVNSNMQLLPAQLQQLTLSYKRWYADNSPEGAQVKLQHLTSLQRLQVQTARLAEQSSVPPNLLSLCLWGHWPARGILGLASLHLVNALHVRSSSISRQHLELLQQLPQLKTLSLELQDHQNLLGIATSWPGLPLCRLMISAESITPTGLHQLMQHVAAGTRLTKLDLWIGEMDLDADGFVSGNLVVCEHLQALKQLESLSMNIGRPVDFEESDTQHLSTLTKLTSLKLCCDASGPFVDEATLSLLAMSLTGLRVLSCSVDGDYYEHQINVMAALPAIGRLTQLENLQLQSVQRDQVMRGLQFLTGLSRLTQLVGFGEAGQEVVDEFFAAIRRQQQGLAQ